MSKSQSQAKVIDNAANKDERKILLATVIRTNEDQDQAEQQQHGRQYLRLFQQQLQEITQNGQRSELFRLVLQDIQKVNHKITEYNDSYEPIRWNIEFIMMNGQRHRLSPEEAIQFNRRAVAWRSCLYSRVERPDGRRGKRHRLMAYFSLC